MRSFKVSPIQPSSEALAFGDRYWWQDRRFLDNAATLQPRDVDSADFRELAENLPSLCWIADADGYITWYNRRWHEYCGTTPQDMEGWGWQSVHDPEVLPRVMEAWTGSIASGEPFEMVFPLRGADGEFRPFLTRIIPLRNEAGVVRRWIGNNVEISRQVATERELRGAQQELETVNRHLTEREAFLSSVLAASTDCIKVLELDGTLSFMSEGGMKVMDVGDFNAVRGCPWPDFMKGGGVGLAKEAIDAAREGRSSHFETEADTLIGIPKWWSVSVSPIFGEDGSVARILSVSRDHTALEEAREQQRLLNGELSHRLKNVLTLVQSIANQTLRDADSLESASAAFSSRLASLGRATDVLTATSWHQAELHDLVEAGLLGVVGLKNRIAISGPRLTMNPQVSMALTLALHELATNATKYGALSNDAGTVTLEWQVTDKGGLAHFALLWREQGGPPVVTPTRRGFGTRMIERSLRSYFRGQTALSYPSEGVEFRIDAPLAGAGTVAV